MLQRLLLGRIPLVVEVALAVGLVDSEVAPVVVVVAGHWRYPQDWHCLAGRP